MFQRLVNGAWQPFHRSLPCLGSYACADAKTKRPKKRPLQSGLFASAVQKASERMKLKSRPLFACKTIDVGPSRIGGIGGISGARYGAAARVLPVHYTLTRENLCEILKPLVVAPDRIADSSGDCWLVFSL